MVSARVRHWDRGVGSRLHDLCRKSLVWVPAISFDEAMKSIETEEEEVTEFAEDQLRQRVAFALSQILVVGEEGLGKRDEVEAYATYVRQRAAERCLA